MTAAPALESQLDELRRLVETLQAAVLPQPRASLIAVESALYLGQAVGLTLTVVNRPDSTPVLNAPVTLVTSWGVLRGQDGLIEGTSIATTTGSDGAVRVTLRPHVSLDDNEDQDALEAMLALLDPNAASPADAVAVFQTLAQQYRWEANSGYRNAVDAYFRDFGQKILNSTQLRDYMTAWSLIPATVIAHVAETDNNAAAAATATVAFRDWLGPWYQAYQGYASSQIQLSGDFAFVKQQASSAAGLIAGVFARTGNLVESEFGEIGKNVAQRVAQSAIGDFLNTGVSDLSVDLRQAVGPILDTGSRALVSAGGSVVAALGQAHAAAVTAAGDLVNKVNVSDLGAALAVKANASDLIAVQTAVGAKADLSALTAFRTQTTSALAAKADLTALAGKANASDLQAVQATVASKADQTALASFQSQTTAALGAKADAGALTSFQTQINNALAAKADAADLRTLQATVAAKADAGALTSFQTQVTSALAAKADAADLRTLQTTVAAKADASALTTFQTQINNALAAKADAADLRTLQATVAAKADAAALTTFQTQINSALTAKANASDLKALQAIVAAKADTAALTALQTQLTTAIAAKADTTALATLQTQTTAALRAKADLTTLTVIERRVTTLEGRLG